MITTLPSLSLALLFATATTGMPATTMPTTSAQIEATTGPVTVRSGPAVVLPNAADYQTPFADLDKNHDGRITRNEIPAGHALATEFKLVDSNHNGSITAAELAAWH